MTFSKGGQPIQKVGPLFPFVKQTAKFALSGSNVSCQFDVAPGLWVSSFDTNQIGQVVDNLIINAQQAMPVGGTINIVARNISFAEGEHHVLSAGKYVEIAVKDSGIGIAKKMLSKIFDPFFTTKTKGHGLGLATCFSIIGRHKGYIDVASELGEGTTFTFYLPAITESDQSEEQVLPVTHKGVGTIIIMDDEIILRDIVSEMLVSFGYSVEPTADGKEALRLFRESVEANRPIAGMIFDLTIPGGMSGIDTVREIRKIDSEVPVFVVSGYAEDPAVKNPEDYGFTASLCKPFLVEELTQMFNQHMK